MDGAAEKNTHAQISGKNEPFTKASVYVEIMESGAKRDSDHIEQ